MAALDFPASPVDGQAFTSNGITYYYNANIGTWLTQLVNTNVGASGNTQVLFNDAGVANGNNGLVFNKGSGYLGIGTTSPSAKLHIQSGSSVTQPTWASSDIVIFGSPTGNSCYIQSHSDTAGGFVFSNTTTRAKGYILWNNITGESRWSNDGSGSLFIRNNGADRVTIDSSGNVGIGTTTPGYKLHVEGETFLGRTDSSTEGGQLSFARSSDNSLLYAIDVNGAGSSPEFRLLNQAGGVVFFSAAPAGVNYIKFNPTQMAIGDANVLDDYEEGTFTPTVAPSSGAITSYTASGVYTKIGRVVEVTISVGITNVGTAAGAYLNVYGLPFTSGSNYFIGVCRENAVNGYLSQVSLGSGATSFSVLLYNNNGVLVNGGDYKMSIVYRTST